MVGNVLSSFVSSLTLCLRGQKNSNRVNPYRTETDAQATDPQATDPQATDPEATDPRATDPRATDPQQIQHDNRNRWMLESGAIVTIPCPAKVPGVSARIDSLTQNPEFPVPFHIPPSIDPQIAQMYIDYITLLTPPFVPSGYRSTHMRYVWRKVNAFFKGKLPNFPMYDWTLAVYETNAQLWEDVVIDSFRCRAVFNRDRFDDDKYKFLLTAPFDTNHHKLELDFNSCALLDSRIKTLPKEPSWSAIKDVCEHIVETVNFPWMATTYASKQYGVIIAGGRMVAALYETVIARQDIDMFIVADDMTNAMEAYDECIAAIRNSFPSHEVFRSINERFTDVFVVFKDDPESILCKFQIMHMAYPSPSHVVHGFDIDVCGILFDGKDVYCTKNAARAISNGYIFYNENTLSTTAEARYKKYNHNYGLRILVAGISSKELNPGMYRNMIQMGNFSKVHDVPTLITLLDKDDIPVEVSDYGDYALIDYLQVFRRNFNGRDIDTVPIVSNIQSVTMFMYTAHIHNERFTGSYNPVISDTLGRLHFLRN